MVEQRCVSIRLRCDAAVGHIRRCGGRAGAQIAEARGRDEAEAASHQFVGEEQAMVEAATRAMDGEQHRPVTAVGIFHGSARQRGDLAAGGDARERLLVCRPEPAGDNHRQREAGQGGEKGEGQSHGVVTPRHRLGAPVGRTRTLPL